MQYDAGAHYLIASPEKALCDKLYYLPRLQDLDAISLYFTDDLRINELRLKELDIKLIEQIVQLSGKQNLRLLWEYLQCS